MDQFEKTIGFSTSSSPKDAKNRFSFSAPLCHARLPRIVSASAPAFGSAGVQAVGTWLFAPPMMGGKAVVVRVQVPLTFSLKAPAKAKAVEPAK